MMKNNSQGTWETPREERGDMHMDREGRGDLHTTVYDGRGDMHSAVHDGKPNKLPRGTEATWLRLDKVSLTLPLPIPPTGRNRGNLSLNVNKGSGDTSKKRMGDTIVARENRKKQRGAGEPLDITSEYTLRGGDNNSVNKGCGGTIIKSGTPKNSRQGETTHSGLTNNIPGYGGCARTDTRPQ